MLQTFRNAWRIEELRKKILFTLLIVLLYRLGNAGGQAREALQLRRDDDLGCLAVGDLLHGLDGYAKLRSPDLICVVLDPAGLRIILPKRLLRVSADTAIAPEQNGARAGRPLIKRQNIPLHEDTPLFIWTGLCYTNE